MKQKYVSFTSSLVLPLSGNFFFGRVSHDGELMADFGGGVGFIQIKLDFRTESMIACVCVQTSSMPRIFWCWFYTTFSYLALLSSFFVHHTSVVQLSVQAVRGLWTDRLRKARDFWTDLLRRWDMTISRRL